MSGSAVNVPGANPAGANTELQFNNAGVFGGISGATSDGTNITSLNIKPASFGMLGSTSGTLTVSAPATITSHTIIFPAAIGTANQALTISNAGTGQLAWSNIALTGITTSLNTASPNNTVNASRILASGGSTNQDLVLSPKGSGAIVVQLPDSTSTGGNKRGSYAVDLQMARVTAAQVASGSYSVAVGRQNTSSGNMSFTAGFSNTASGDYSTALGTANTASGTESVAAGYACTASGYGAIAIGDTLTASGTVAVALGYDAVAAGNYSFALGAATSTSANSFCVGLATGTETAAVQSWNISSGGVTDVRNQGVVGCIAGYAQSNIYTLQRATANDTPTTMHPNGDTGTEYLTIRSDKVYAFTALVAGRNITDGGGCGYEFKGLIENAGGTVALIGTVAKTVIAETTAGYDCDITADDTNNCLTVTVTGLASKDVRWSATIIITAAG